MLYKQKDNGIVLNVKVLPNSSKNEICGMFENALKIKIKAPAVENKANVELIKFLAKEIGVAKTSMSVISGQTSKIKNIYIADLSVEKIESFYDKIGLTY